MTESKQVLVDVADLEALRAWWRGGSDQSEAIDSLVAAIPEPEPEPPKSKALGEDSQRAALADALQDAWNDWCSDTGCIPDGFSIRGPRTTQVTADFGVGNFVTHVVQWLDAEGFAVVLTSGSES